MEVSNNDKSELFFRGRQCILQILEPICEAKFSDNSYGFRPLRSAENAIAAEMRLINQSKLHFVVEVDIKSFFDEVNHAKLMRQIWAMGMGKKSKDYEKYGKSSQLRYIGEQWILPLAYVQCRNPMCKRREASIYTTEGKELVHKELQPQKFPA